MANARVLMIAFTYYRSDTRVRRLADSLVQRGDSVDFLCLSEPDLPDEVGGVRLRGIAKRRLNNGIVGQFLEYIIFTLCAIFWALRLHWRKRYSVIHIHTMPDFLVVAGALPRLLGARLLLDIHDTFPELFAVRMGLSEKHILVRLLKWVERTSARLAHRVIAVHEPHRDQLIDHGIPASKIDVVLNLPDEHVFPRASARPTGDSIRPLQVFYHGTISKHLALDTMIDAASSIVREREDVRFRLLGGGNAAQELYDRVQAQSLESHVQVIPKFRPVDQIVEEIAEADIGVIPCRINRATDLMLPTKLLEYVRMGIPCVAPRTTAISHYFDESMVRFWEPNDPDSFRLAIVDLLESAELRRCVAEAADAFNDRFTWSIHRHDYFASVDGDCVLESAIDSQTPTRTAAWIK